MPKFKILTGPFEGEIVEEGHTFISHLNFQELDDDMQLRIREYGEDRYFAGSSESEDDADFPVPLNDLVQEYENSWESVEV